MSPLSLRGCFCLSALLSLAACQSTAPLSTVHAPVGITYSESLAWPAHLAQVDVASPEWTWIGRGSVQHGEGRESFRFQWAQASDTYQIDLMGPLGAEHHRLVGDAETIALFTPNGKHESADSPEQLVEALFGLRVPVSSLRAWLRARPEPARSFEAQVDHLGRPHTLLQDGWLLQYRYGKAGQHLPERVTIENEEVRLVLVIQERRYP